MTFPFYPLPINWLQVVAQYYAYAYTGGDVYAYSGDISANTEAQWDALTWTDGRMQPSYATLADPAMQQEALASMGGYLGTVNYFSNAVFLAQAAADITSLKASRTTDETAISSAASSASTQAATLSTATGDITSLKASRTTDEANITALQQAVTRTTTSISPSLVGTGATGSQASATKASTVRIGLNESVTSSIGGAATAVINIKVCTTNSATEANWTTIATFEEDQTVTLAIALQSIQVMKGMLEFDLAPGMWWKAESSGSGTNSESVLLGQQTIYG